MLGSMNLLKDIKPNGKTSDKYSINLWKYITKHQGEMRVFYEQTEYSVKEDCEIFVPFDPNNIKPYKVWIGQLSEDWYYVGHLSTILGNGKEKFTQWANPWLKSKQPLDITEWFWKEYIKNGRCLFDKDHSGWWIGDEDRFYHINKNNKKCKWCGAMLKREIKTVKVIKRTEHWTVQK